MQNDVAQRQPRAARQPCHRLPVDQQGRAAVRIMVDGQFGIGMGHRDLDLVARDCSALADPWWVFGSAGMALVGVPGLAPPDVDLIVSERDATTLVAAWKAAPTKAACC